MKSNFAHCDDGLLNHLRCLKFMRISDRYYEQSWLKGYFSFSNYCLTFVVRDQ